MFSDQHVEQIKQGEIGVIPTDTLYGLVASVYDSEAVERVYRVKSRNPRKACIVLIPDIQSLSDFGIEITNNLHSKLQVYWPGPNSILLPCGFDRWKHIHRGTNMIAFRLPDNDDLRNFLRKTGPIIAPSANPEGMPPAKNIPEVREYFGDTIDFSVDGGNLDNPPSRLIKISADEADEILR